MKRGKIKFDMSYLADAVDAQIGRCRLAEILSVDEGRLDSILYGEVMLSVDEILRLAEILQLESAEFERYFFTPKSSENLNNKKTNIR